MVIIVVRIYYIMPTYYSRTVESNYFSNSVVEYFLGENATGMRTKLKW